MSKPPDPRVEKMLDEIDNYRQTVGAILALGTILIRYYKAAFRVGRKLQPSLQNRIQNHDEITPDILAQGNDLNLIGEVKKSFPMNEEYWLKSIKQIEKYDDKLTNWVNENVETHDLMLLTHISRSMDLKNFVEKKLGDGTVTFSRPLSIVEFVRDSERHVFWHLRKIWGNISNEILDEYLTNGRVNLKGDNIVNELSSVWFYDSEPMIPDTMSLIWGKIFSEKATTEKYIESGGRRIIELMITVDEIVDKCREYFAMPDSSLPKKEWIKKAMDGLVKLKRAKKVSGETYTVHYHRIGQDMLETFTKEWIENSSDITEFFPPQQEQTDTHAQS